MDQLDPIMMAEDDVMALVGRAAARERFPDLGFEDRQAEDIVAKLDLDLDRFDTKKLRVATMETMAIDSLVRDFFTRHPTGLAVALSPGLCTRFSRVDNGELRWVDLEPPNNRAFDGLTERTSERHLIGVRCSRDGDSCWIARLSEARSIPTLIVSQGGLLKACLHHIDAFFTNVTRRLVPGTEIIVDYDARSPLRRSSLDPERACLEIASPDGEIARYPGLRFVAAEQYPSALAHELAGLQSISRLFRGRGIPSIAHLRLR